MKLLGSARTYRSYARNLGRHWEMGFLSITTKLLISRLAYGRGPGEFDQYRFAAKCLLAWKDYVDEGEMKNWQERSSPPVSRHLDENKTQFWRRCVDSGLPTIPILAVLAPSSEMGVAEGLAIAHSASELRQILEPLGDFDGFAKPLGGGQGYGAFTFRIREGTVSALSFKGSIPDLFTHCVSLPFGAHGYVLQPQVPCHPDLSLLMPGPGIGAVRLVTFLSREGEVSIPWAILKIPGPGQITDNGRMGRLAVPVEVATGKLGPAVGRTADIPVFHEMLQHPVSGARFSVQKLPMWAEVLSLITQAAHAFGELPCLGWDVLLTDKGPALLETNWWFGIAGQQVAFNRGLKAEVRKHFARCIQL